MTTSSALGNVLGAFLSGLLIENLGWEAVFYVFGLLNIGLGVLLLFVLFDSPFYHPSISNSEKSLYSNVEEAGSLEEQGVRNFELLHYYLTYLVNVSRYVTKEYVRIFKDNFL